MIYATGAQTDKSLGIPGEDLPGSWAATEFVAWYNGHPDYRDLEFDLSAQARRRDRQRQRRRRRRAHAHAERRRARAHGRRRPRAGGAAREPRSRRSSCSAAAAPRRRRSRAPSCASSGRLDGVQTRVDPDDARARRRCRSEWLADEGTFTARKNVELLRELADRGRRARGARRRIELRFLRSPVRDPRRRPRSRRSTCAATRSCAPTTARCGRGALDDDVETIECGLVLRSVGYRAVPLPGVPFDERSFVLPNERGRVLTPDGEPLPGVYAVGWIKRGPTGILGTNKRDAEETVTLPRRGPRGRRAAAAAQPGPRADRRAARRAQARPRHRRRAGARSTREELERGRSEQRPRVKLASRDELLATAGR